MKIEIKKIIREAIIIKEKIFNNDQTLETVETISDIIIQNYKRNGKILIAGNGGSAADAQHIAAEFVSKFYLDRPGIPAIAITTDTSIITAIGNDYSFENVISRQLETLGVSGDVFLAISTSGKSKNIINAVNIANEKGITTIGLTGKSGNTLAEICNYCICVPSENTPRIQEAHIMIGHIICEVVEEKLFG